MELTVHIGLFKMREQEYDAKPGCDADGGTPGVTVPFVFMQTEILQELLLNPALKKQNPSQRRNQPCCGMQRSALSRNAETVFLLESPYIKHEKERPDL